MKNKKHLMLDLETLGSTCNAPVIQIGAYTSTGEEFIINVKFEDALAHGKPCGSTIEWWFNQNEGARKSLLGNSVSVKDALEMLAEFVKSCKVDYYWSHATFDFPIINRLYTELGTKNAMWYGRQLDLRTITALTDGNVDQPVREGNHHNALDDCKHQMKWLLSMLDE